jgi:glutathione S-transferase
MIGQMFRRAAATAAAPTRGFSARVAKTSGVAVLGAATFTAGVASCDPIWPFSSTPKVYEPPVGIIVDHPPVVLHYRPKGEEGPKPKVLEYFAIHGLGEVIRLMLEVSETPYDSVMHFNGDVFKGYAPFGQLPTYTGDEIPGVIMTQSNSILRHLARHLGMAGCDKLELLVVDMLHELSQDIINKKEGIMDPSHDSSERLHTALKSAEKFAPKNKSFFVGTSMTLADVSMFHTLHLFNEIDGKCLDKYPKLKAFHARFAARPQIVAYFNSDRRMPYTSNDLKPRIPGADGYKYMTPLSPSAYAEMAF